MKRLTLPKVCDLANGQDVREVKVLNASSKDIELVDDISPCVELVKLNLSRNLISSTDGFRYCSSLTWLDVSHNQIVSLAGIQSLLNLSVLNAGHNRVSVIGNLSSLKTLKALILNNNEISAIEGLSSLSKLNSLVLSHNQMETISVKKLSLLTKLSLSHNLLRAFPDTTDCHQLKELRLNSNKLFSALPSSMESNQRLELLDIGNNLLDSWGLCRVLCKLTSLRNLNLNGNNMCTSDDICDKVLHDIPSLEVVNGRKRNYYDESVAAEAKTKKKAASSGTESNTSSLEIDTPPLIKTQKPVRKGKVKKNSKEEANSFEEVALKKKRKRQRDSDVLDEFSERYSITAITGLQPSKKKHKEKSVSGVVSVSKPKMKSLKRDTDISALIGGVEFGTGQRTQWF